MFLVQPNHVDYFKLVLTAQKLAREGLHCREVNLTAEQFYAKMKWYAEADGNRRRLFLQSAQFPNQEGLCQNCFMRVYGVPRNTFYRNRRPDPVQSSSGANVPTSSSEHGNDGTLRASPTYLQAIAFVQTYSKQYGDFMPDKDEIHLPDFSWKSVREKFVSQLEAPVSQSTFSRVKDSLPHILIRKCKRFSQCQWCGEIKNKIKTATGATRKFWRDELRQHNDWQMRERTKQANHVNKASHPETRDDYMVIMIDGMDHSKSSLPHFGRTPKDLDSAESLQTHITGIHVPGWAERPFTCYTWHDLFPTGSDSVITMILKILCDYAKAHDDKLPPKLFLHMDNCWRENKNRYVLGIAHLLVHMGCFKRVDLCFLPVGHTHNIVDQMFSRFSVAMQDKNFFTVDELHQICINAYDAASCTCGQRYKLKKEKVDQKDCSCPTKSVFFEHINEMACWKPILQSYMTKSIRGISKPRYFRVQRDADGVVRHHYRSQLQTPKTVDQTERNAHAGVSSLAAQVNPHSLPPFFNMTFVTLSP